MDCTYYDVVIVAVQGLPEVEVVIHILTKDRQSQLKRHHTRQHILTMNTVQGWAKEWYLGCVNLAS